MVHNRSFSKDMHHFQTNIHSKQIVMVVCASAERPKRRFNGRCRTESMVETFRKKVNEREDTRINAKLT